MRPKSRRQFLKYFGIGTGTALVGFSWWASVSQRRSARLLRRLVADARREVLPATVKPVPQTWSDNRITLAWLGHSTVLINFYGVTILTDPVLADYIGVSLGLATIGPKRFIAPALRFKELPPIDLVLLSHAHMDHMDLPTLSRFPAGTPTVTAPVTRDILGSTRLQIISELPWGEHASIRCPKGELQIEAIQVKHWGERWPSKAVRGYNGYVLRREGKALLFGGDTALTPHLGEIRSRGPFEVAIMPIGSYRPWIWNHCTPEESLQMANAAGARRILPVHHQTFCLSEEPMNEPIERLQAALAHEPERLALKRIGESFSIA